MARDPKLEVAAINIRIPDDRERDYGKLISRLSEMRRGVRVYGDSYVAISLFDTNGNIGIFSKYTEIDIDGDWFDLDDFDAATPEKVEEVRIPEALKPNLSQFFFRLVPEEHVIIFSSYAESRGLSTRSVLKYFKEAFGWKEVRADFGRVEADVVQSYAAVEELLDQDDLKEIRLIIRRPNADDISRNLARIIEERLKENNGDEYEEILRSKDGGDLTPSERTRQLGSVAAENGDVRTKSVINGVMRERHTAESPLVESQKYKPDEPEFAIFASLSEKILEKIKAARDALRK